MRLCCAGKNHEPTDAGIAPMYAEGFDQWPTGAIPSGWTITSDNGGVEITDANPAQGSRALRLVNDKDAPSPIFAELDIDAVVFQDNWVRVTMQLRHEEASGSASAYLQVNGESNGSTITLGGPATDDRPVYFDHWLDRGQGQSSIASAPASLAPTVTIIAHVAKDAKWLRMGFGTSGGGNAVIDDIVTTTTAKPQPVAVAQSPLSDREARNIAALARVYGVIRAFEASDEAIFA